MWIVSFPNVVGPPIKPRPSMATAGHASLGAERLCRVQWLTGTDLREAD